MRRLLLTIFLCLTCCAMKAQPAYSLRTFSVRDGLPTNNITAIHQAPGGLIWIATWNGLCCYDGNRFTTFTGDSWGSDNALSTQRISAIGPDSQGNVWVRTYDGNLYLLDGHTCRYLNVGLQLRQQYGVDFQPRNIYVLPNGHTWITDSGNALNLRIDDRYAATTDSMEVWGTKGRPVRGSYLQKVECDGEGREWLVTDRGMMRYGSEEFREGVFTTRDTGRPTADHAAAAERYVGEHHIGKHLIDRQGNLWYVNGQGLTLVNFKRYDTRLLPLVEGEQTRSVCCRRDGTVWAGSYSGYIGVFAADGRQLGWLTPQGAVSAAKVRFSTSVYALCEDRDGRMWIGTKGSGLYVVAADGRSVRHYTHDDGDAYSLSHDDIYDIHQDAQGRIWIATWGGGVNLVRHAMPDAGGKAAELRFVHKDNELKGYPQTDFNKVRRVTHDGQGHLLASTTTGLLTFAAKEKDAAAMRFYTTQHHHNDTTSLRANDVAQVLVTAKGTVYVVTMGGCIQRIASRQLLQNDLTLQSAGIMNEGTGSVLSMVEDRQGDIWIVRESEVNRFVAKGGRLDQFGPNSMPGRADLAEAQPVVHPDGSVWIGATDGVLTFQPRDMHKSQYRPTVVFTGVQYQGEQELYPLLNQTSIVVDQRDRRNLTVFFSALDYENDYLMQYAYRLKEGDGTWNYIGHNPSISFNQLSPGRHVLMVKSTNADGVWVDNVTELTVDIQPLLWERTWFRLLMALLTVALSTWVVLRWLRRRQEHREREQRLASIMRQYQELQEELESKSRDEERQAGNGEAPAAPKKEYRLEEPQIVDADEEMMNRLMAFIEQHISDEGLRIEDMADAVSLGRTVFYEKLKALVGVSPSDFLKQIRMQRAEQLMRKSRMTVSEVAYAIGFTDPKYFTKCFKKQTGMTPSEYREKAPAAN